ncbi:ABC-2 type transporter [Pyrolobus fumarii 1A]|uniref:ABC-2 type transporter n=1 Tax=Pyrolobus fumarii (strain DSM 11204 / 1A) TaxID=694429 RepID=G0EHH8_PYRF1|nr:ABC transporter permease [Pyrolobus fumarii]AEM38553.1 ABC-2 type transporter [Pyrolobus fumarii 1A]
MSLRLLLSKELRMLAREHMVVLSVILPLILYSSMGPVIGGIAEQARETWQLKGVVLAIVPGGPDEEKLAEMIADALRGRGVNASVVREEPLKLLEEGYTAVVAVPRGFVANITKGVNATLVVYVAGSPAQLVRLTSLTPAVSAFITKVLSGAEAQRPRINVDQYVYVSGRLFTQDEIVRLTGTATMLTYLPFFVIFPAASIGAIMMGVEREERMLEVLLSLPVRRRDISLAKVISSLIIAFMTAASATIGLYNMLRGMKTEATLALPGYTPEITVVYIAALLSSAIFTTTVIQVLSLFAETVRGAQATTVIVVFPMLGVVLASIAGLPLNPAMYAVPFMCIVYAAYAPLIGIMHATISTIIQALEALIVLALLVKLLNTEIAITGPAMLKKLRERLSRRGR